MTNKLDLQPVFTSVEAADVGLDVTVTVTTAEGGVVGEESLFVVVARATPATAAWYEEQ